MATMKIVKPIKIPKNAAKNPKKLRTEETKIDSLWYSIICPRLGALYPHLHFIQRLIFFKPMEQETLPPIIAPDPFWFLEILIGIAVLIGLNYLFKKIIRYIRQRSLSKERDWKEK